MIWIVGVVVLWLVWKSFKVSNFARKTVAAATLQALLESKTQFLLFEKASMEKEARNLIIQAWLLYPKTLDGRNGFYPHKLIAVALALLAASDKEKRPEKADLYLICLCAILSEAQANQKRYNFSSHEWKILDDISQMVIHLEPKQPKVEGADQIMALMQASPPFQIDKSFADTFNITSQAQRNDISSTIQNTAKQILGAYTYPTDILAEQTIMACLVSFVAALREVHGIKPSPQAFCLKYADSIQQDLAYYYGVHAYIYNQLSREKSMKNYEKVLYEFMLEPEPIFDRFPIDDYLDIMPKDITFNNQATAKSTNPWAYYQDQKPPSFLELGISLITIIIVPLMFYFVTSSLK